MKSIIKGIILGIFLSFFFSPVTAHAYKPIPRYIAEDMRQGIDNISIEYVLVKTSDGREYVEAVPSHEKKSDVYTNYGKGWKFVEKELNEIGVYLDENGMIMDGTVYTMPKK